MKGTKWRLPFWCALLQTHGNKMKLENILLNLESDYATRCRYRTIGNKNWVNGIRSFHVQREIKMRYPYKSKYVIRLMIEEILLNNWCLKIWKTTNEHATRTKKFLRTAKSSGSWKNVKKKELDNFSKQYKTFTIINVLLTLLLLPCIILFYIQRWYM